MRLTFIISSLGCGGAERVLSILANYWAEKHWKITVLSLDHSGAEPFYDLHPEVLHRPLGLTGISRNASQALRANFTRVKVLRQAIKVSQPEVVISFMAVTNVLTILATRGLDVPVVVSERVDPAKYRIGPFWSLLRKFLYPFADHLVSQTNTALRFFSRSVRSHATVIPNPVLCPPVRANLPRKAGPMRIVSMGRLDEQKGFDILLEAMAQVVSRVPDCVLTIWGEGASRGRLEKLREQLDLEARVNLPGRTSDIPMAFAEADLFVMSSRYEGFPNALCEAMACGLPVICTDCPSGPADIIRDGIDGLLVPVENSAALADAMEMLLREERQRAALSARAREVVERFGLSEVAAAWEKVLRPLCCCDSRESTGQAAGAIGKENLEAVSHK
jgi:glycosyltransferase involved in cell wall biosynthesis